MYAFSFASSSLFSFSLASTSTFPKPVVKACRHVILYNLQWEIQPLPHLTNQSLNASVPPSLLKRSPQTLYCQPLLDGYCYCTWHWFLSVSPSIVQEHGIWCSATFWLGEWFKFFEASFLVQNGNIVFYPTKLWGSCGKYRAPSGV